ncbi:MAG TPA: hypothetical protein HA254_04345 [Candidatus Diapherotrites archaeon]|uniref:Uncharacterized protein n=1 Tax=Candidatus Iainarchaeum sp. TaxID=3101447 RepID=A0A7J4IYE4_9ARCH|nr:hypothetical protein [Candidatus Diapherotrites archaeon]
MAITDSRGKGAGIFLTAAIFLVIGIVAGAAYASIYQPCLPFSGCVSQGSAIEAASQSGYYSAFRDLHPGSEISYEGDETAGSVVMSDANTILLIHVEGGGSAKVVGATLQCVHDTFLSSTKSITTLISFNNFSEAEIRNALADNTCK